MINVAKCVESRSFLKRTLFVCIALLPACAHAVDSSSSVHDAVVKALEYNPEVQDTWHAFKAANYQVGEARAGYLPSVDLSLTGGKVNRDFDGRERYTETQGQVTLTQMLFDGFRTSGQVDHLEGGRLVRYYELLNSVETTAFETVRAFEDVSRERALIALARDNYAKHQEVYRQIEGRVSSGVGRKVDLEQVAGRLALAETNLLTEASNLHDVTARYLRVVGSMPAADLKASGLADSRLPPSIRETLIMAFEGNPGFKAAIKNIKAAEGNVDVERSGFYPKVQLRARENANRNTNGFDERVDATIYGKESAVELAVTYNLYAGGGTRAALRRSLEEVNQAKDLRDKACVDLRQNTQIAYSDAHRLSQQLASLDQHRRSSDKVRVAYGEQFRVGQRSLLDLLDAENEYFQASRAYVTALGDLNIAHAKTLAAMGQLLAALNITREALMQVHDADVKDNLKVDGNSACPLDAPDNMGLQDLVGDIKAAEPIEMPAPAAAPVAQVMTVSGDALFAVGSSVLSFEAAHSLDKLVYEIVKIPKVKQIKIDGHTDSKGSDSLNVPLSKARAESVRKYFEQHGLEHISILVDGRGSAIPVGDNNTESGRASNRRVEVTVFREP